MIKPRLYGVVVDGSRGSGDYVAHHDSHEVYLKEILNIRADGNINIRYTIYT